MFVPHLRYLEAHKLMNSNLKQQLSGTAHQNEEVHHLHVLRAPSDGEHLQRFGDDLPVWSASAGGGLMLTDLWRSACVELTRF